MKKILSGMLAAGLVASSGAVQAAEDAWSLEVTPYAWLCGIDADVTVGNKKGEVDVGFEDIIDYVDVAGGLLVIGELNRLQVWGQIDYMSLSSDQDVTKFDELGTLDSDTLILEAGVGYEFDNPLAEGAKIDLLGGVRYTSLENSFDPKGAGPTVESDRDLVDPIVIVRPWFPITEKLTFNPTMGVGGGGDSDLIYELQPQFQYQFTDTMAGRIGYRRLFYETEGDRAKFDGSFQGVIAGLGITL